MEIVGYPTNFLDREVNIDKYGKVKREDSMRVIEVYIVKKLKKYITCYLDSG